MLKKLIVATVMLLLAAVQAFAVNCDLRCSLMTVSAGIRGCGNHPATKSSRPTRTQCHGTAMDSGNDAKSALNCGDCDASTCNTHLEALVKKSTGDESLSNLFVMSTPAELIRVFDEFSFRSSLHRTPERQNTSAPLELRPGSSLRI